MRPPPLRRSSIRSTKTIGLSPLDREVIDLDKARSCAYHANYHSGPLNTGARYFWAQLRLRLLKVLKTIATNHGFQLLAAKVHHGNHIHVFVSARPKLCIPEMVRVLKCNSVRLLFEEFSELKLQLWGGHLWSEGYAVRTAGVVTSAKIEEYINKN